MLSTLITQLIDFIHANPHTAYLVVLLLAMSESLPAVGAIVPGTAIIVALSALVPSGILVLWPLLGAAVAGAVLGDGLSFWLGRHYDSRLLMTWPFSRYPGAIKHSETFFARYGAYSIFIARFLPGVRAFVPVLAGVFGISVKRFYAVNIASAVVWAPVHILPGVLVGTAFHALGPAAKPLAGLILTFIVLAWLLVHGVRLFVRKALPALEGFSGYLKHRLSVRQDPVSRAVLNLIDPDAGEARAIALLIVVLLCFAWLFFGIFEDVFTGDPLVRMDVAIYNLLKDFRSHPSDVLMIAITELGDTTIVIAVSCVAIAYLAWKRAKHALIFFISAVAGASLINTVIKVALHRARPIEDLYQGWSAFSFPSGHSTVNMALYGSLAFLVFRSARTRLKFLVPIVAAVLVFAIAFSRLYLGAHWFSDVAGGLAFGMTWLSLLGILLLQRAPERFNPNTLAVLPVIVLATFGTVHVSSRHSSDLARYAVQDVSPKESFQTWWSKDGSNPGGRIDITGETKEPFILEWAGSKGALLSALIAHGWKAPNDWSLSSLTVMSHATNVALSVPVVPSMSSGQFPDAILVRPLNDGHRRLVLRLWKEALQIEAAGTWPLWKVSVTQERLERPLGLITIPLDEGDASRSVMPLLLRALAPFPTKQQIVDGTLKAHAPALQ